MKIQYPEDWDETIPVETYEEQVFDKTKYRYGSSMLIGEMFWSHGGNRWRTAYNAGIIPYIGEDNFIHWKQKRNND